MGGVRRRGRRPADRMGIVVSQLQDLRVRRRRDLPAAGAPGQPAAGRGAARSLTRAYGICGGRRPARTDLRPEAVAGLRPQERFRTQPGGPLLGAATAARAAHPARRPPRPAGGGGPHKDVRGRSRGRRRRTGRCHHRRDLRPTPGVTRSGTTQGWTASLLPASPRRPSWRSSRSPWSTGTGPMSPFDFRATSGLHDRHHEERGGEEADRPGQGDSVTCPAPTLLVQGRPGDDRAHRAGPPNKKITTRTQVCDRRSPRCPRWHRFAQRRPSSRRSCSARGARRRRWLTNPVA